MSMKHMARAMGAGGSEESKARRADGEFFPTPREATQLFVKFEARAVAAMKERGRTIWEPAAGQGHMSRELRAAGLEIVETDKRQREGSVGQTGLDFLTGPAPQKVSAPPVIVTNPPWSFDIAAGFIRRALDHHRADYLALLLNNNFFVKNKSAPRLWRSHPPTRFFFVGIRLDFTGKGHPMPPSAAWWIWDQAFFPGDARAEMMGAADLPADDRGTIFEA